MIRTERPGFYKEIMRGFQAMALMQESNRRTRVLEEVCRFLEDETHGEDQARSSMAPPL